MTTDTPPARQSDLAIRTVAGIAMVTVAIAALWFGGLVFWMLSATLGLLIIGEWAELDGAPVTQKRLARFALVVPLAIMAPAPLAAGPGFLALGLIGAAAFFIVIVTRRPTLAAGAVYAGLPILALLLIRHQKEGVIFTLWALALVWMCDIGAYFAGRAIGGAKLAPAISPNKTWAGLIGGVVLASAFGALMHVEFGLPWRLTLATPFLAVLAQGGDLFESWLKRRAGVKDSGTILPGHGGILDRLDGLIPVAPVAAFLVVLPSLVTLPKILP